MQIFSYSMKHKWKNFNQWEYGTLVEKMDHKQQHNAASWWDNLNHIGPEAYWWSQNCSLRNLQFFILMIFLHEKNNSKKLQRY